MPRLTPDQTNCRFRRDLIHPWSSDPDRARRTAGRDGAARSGGEREVARAQSVIVGNTSANPVPVKAVSSAQVLFDQIVSGGSAQEVNVSSASEIRVAVHLTTAGCDAQPSGFDHVGILTASHSGAAFSDMVVLDTLTPSCGGSRDATATYVLPGPAITLSFAGGVEAHVMVFGRA